MSISFLYIASIVVAVACFAEAGVIAKLFPRTNPHMTNAIGLSVGAVVLTITSVLRKETWIIPQLLTTWIPFGYIVVFLTVLAYFLYLFVLRWTASGTAYCWYALRS